MSLIRKAFKRLHYPVDVIAQCVRWYLAYSLSLRNLEEMMAERSVVVGVRLENGIYGHSRFCNTDFDDKLACLNLSGV